MGRPKKVTALKIIRTYTVEPDLYSKVVLKADSNYDSVSSIIVRAFKEYVK